MCKELCEGDGEPSCPDCGKLICFDVKSGDDIIRPAYVTSSGDLYCDECGGGHDRAEEMDSRDDWEDEEMDLEELDLNNYDANDGTEGSG